MRIQDCLSPKPLALCSLQHKLYCTIADPWLPSLPSTFPVRFNSFLPTFPILLLPSLSSWLHTQSLSIYGTCIVCQVSMEWFYFSVLLFLYNAWCSTGNKCGILADAPKDGKHFYLCSSTSLPPLPPSLPSFCKYLLPRYSVLSTMLGTWGRRKLQSEMDIIKSGFWCTVRLHCMSPGLLINS